MAVSKVNYRSKILIDLTSDTVTADTLKQGVTAHNAKGEKITGTMSSNADTVDGYHVKVSSTAPTVDDKSVITIVI